SGTRAYRAVDRLEGGVVVRGRDEPRLERTGRSVDPMVEQGVEERRIPPGLAGARRLVVAHRSVAEEDPEHGACALDAVRHRGGRERLAQDRLEPVRVVLQRAV